MPEDDLNEELTAAAEAYFQNLETTVPDEPTEEPPPDEGTEEEPQPEPEVTTPDVDEGPEEPQEEPQRIPSEDVYTFDNGLQLTRNQAAEWARFGQYLQQNPQIAQGLVELLEGQPTEAPAPAEPTVPEGLDLDDPAIASLWNEFQAQKSTIDDLANRVQVHDQYVNQTQMRTYEALINRARASFQKDRNLSDDEMSRVYDVGGRLGVLPSLLSPTDPITGEPRRVDPLSAIEESFEIAIMAIPELREKEIRSQVESQREDLQRKKKLSSLSGSSGSSPRQPAEPRNERERREAMAREIAGMMEGEGV